MTIKDRLNAMVHRIYVSAKGIKYNGHALQGLPFCFYGFVYGDAINNSHHLAMSKYAFLGAAFLWNKKRETVSSFPFLFINRNYFISQNQRSP